MEHAVRGITFPPPIRTQTSRHVADAGTSTVTLDQVTRPRKVNEYVDGFLPRNTDTSRHGLVTLDSHVPAKNNNFLTGDSVRPRSPLLPTGNSIEISKDSELVVKHQNGVTDDRLRQPHESSKDSIICSRCGKCKCRQCTGPQDLPEAWLCDKRIHVTGDSIVECCSCVTCIRAVFYHGFSEEDKVSTCADEPCACCSRPHCVRRWTCLAVLSLFFPCLLCYWPLKCALGCCKCMYNKCCRKGCHCGKTKRRRHTGRKHLLEESTSST